MGIFARVARAGVIAAVVGCTPKPAPAVHWGYTGRSDPGHWAELAPENAACGRGRFQSPIDLHAVARRLARPLRFDYRPDRLRIVNNGHTVQVDHQAGSTLTIAGRTYTLAQYHIHSPSEHTVDGRRFALELHLVHRHVSGDLAVVGVLIDEGSERGAEGEAIARVWDHLPAHAGEVFTGDESVNPGVLLPTSLEHYQYHGSLTTPPCSENVDWSVLVRPVLMSAEHIAEFRRLYRANARPIQARPDWCLLAEPHGGE